MRRRFGLPWMMAMVFLYTTPIMVVTYSLLFILIKNAELAQGVRAGAMAGLLWGMLFTLAMGILTYFKHKELERKYKCVSDYSPIQRRTVQLSVALNETIALSVQTLKDLRWIQADSIKISDSKISAKGSIVMGRYSAISISVISLRPKSAKIEIESRPPHWLPLDCTLKSIKDVLEILDVILKLSRSMVSDIKNGDNSN
jgi:hypothetical protein